MSAEPAFEQQLPQPGEVISERYVIESLIGRGGFGAVFRGRNEATGRSVAIKWLLPQLSMNAEAMARFLAEARTTARIEHPNVVSIYDVGKDKRGSPFIVMELLRGESLRDRLERVGRFDPNECVRLMLPTLKGVAAAHREGVVHRDLKPDNIFLCLDKDGSELPPKVVDFGISKLFDGDGEGKGGGVQTSTGMTIGTPQYMAPEQLNAPKHADERFDVYAMGVVFYEALAGRPPYQAEGLLELLHRIAAGTPTPLRELAPEVHPALEAVVMRAMHRTIGERWRSISDLIQELSRIEQQGLIASGVGGNESLRDRSGDARTPDLRPPSSSGTLRIPTPQPAILGMIGTPSPAGAPRHSPIPSTTPLNAFPSSASLPTTTGPTTTGPTPTGELRAVGTSPLLIGGALAGALALIGVAVFAAIAFGGDADETPPPRAGAAPETAAPETAAPETAPSETAAPPATAASPSLAAAPPTPASLTLAAVAAGPAEFRGQSLTVRGQVYQRRAELGASDFQVAVLEGCAAAPPCFVWVTLRQGEPPAVGTGAEVTGLVLGERRYAAADGATHAMLELDASGVSAIPDHVAAALELPASARRPAEVPAAAPRVAATTPRPTAPRPAMPQPRPFGAAAVQPVAPRPVGGAPAGGRRGLDVSDDW